ncbi:hypothetical protein V8E53_011687 [Lactarius tabidus]
MWRMTKSTSRARTSITHTSPELSSLSVLSMGSQSCFPVVRPSRTEPLLSFGSPSINPRIRKIAQGGLESQKSVYDQGESYRHATTIHILPSDVLLEIFDFCKRNCDTFLPVWKWHLLVHVCRRWRQVVFASPRRLNLQILCTYGTPVKENLGIWPAFPIVIDLYSMTGIPPDDEENVVAALGSKHLDRVMQEPCPVLKHLQITSEDRNAPELPAKFLGGSAPNLREVSLYGIPYPTLPALLWSAIDLVELDLRKIPPTGYISPEAMVVGLAALPRLELLILGFQPHPHRLVLRPPGVTLSPGHIVQVLPSLTYFEFNGASEYLEDLVSRIDVPQLIHILVVYLNQLIDFQAAQLSHFIDRSVGPELTQFKHAHITFSSDKVTFDMCRHANYPLWDWRSARTDILCEGTGWQVSHMAQVLLQFSATLSNVIHLQLKTEPEGLQLMDTDDVEWLLLLRRFSTVRTLHVCQELAGHVALALEDVTWEMVAEILPHLDLICLAGQPAPTIEKLKSYVIE